MAVNVNRGNGMMDDKSLRLLLIEDNPGDAALLEDMLAGSPLQTELCHATHLKDGLEKAQQQHFDAVLLDLSLPDSYGIETIQRANVVVGHLPVLVLTGLDDAEAGIEAVRLGAQDYLVKGEVDTSLLVKSIMYAIERKQTQEALRRANDDLERKVRERTAMLQRRNVDLQMITACNEVIIRATQESQMLQLICQTILDAGDYRMAWIGMAADGPDKLVVPAATVGFEDGYLASTRITWANEPLGRGPTGTAIRTGRPHVGRDFLIEPALAPWREQAVLRGFRSSVALPLICGGTTFGALTIYAAHVDAFDDEKVRLLQRLADDVSFGLEALRTQGALRRTEREILEATEREQRRIGRDLHDSIQSSLVGAKIMLEVLASRMTETSKEWAAQVVEIAQVVGETVQQTRGLARSLCPADLKEHGLAPALARLATTTSSLFRIPCEFNCPVAQVDLDENSATHMYFICLEAVNNAVKHAKAKRITIVLHDDGGSVGVSVQDDGVGIRKGHPDGMGLRTMSYRAKIIGAQLGFRPCPGGGTSVECSLPRAATSHKPLATSH